MLLFFRIDPLLRAGSERPGAAQDRKRGRPMAGGEADETRMARESPPDPFRLDERHVLITGAGGGIGRALVAAFAAAGATVSGADRSGAMMDGLDLAER